MLPLGPYTGSIGLWNSEVGQINVPFQFDCVSALEGNLRVTVVDEFTYYAAGGARRASRRKSQAKRSPMPEYLPPDRKLRYLELSFGELQIRGPQNETAGQERKRQTCRRQSQTFRPLSPEGRFFTRKGEQKDTNNRILRLRCGCRRLGGAKLGAQVFDVRCGARGLSGGTANEFLGLVIRAVRMHLAA